jgi:hypothetical protein
MHKNDTKCNKTLSKWCKNKHGASKIIDTFETYHIPLSFEQVKYAALDSRLEFKIASKCFQLARYNTHVDHLNIALIE